MAIKFQSCVVSKWIIVGILAIMAEEAWAGDIVLNLEEPTSGSVYSGVANIRGWVVGSKGISRVELYIDGQYENNIPVGGMRADVGDDYPAYPNSANSGFSMAFNYSEKTAGMHSIRVRAVDQDSDSREITASFQVVRFEKPYFNDPSQVSLNNVSKSGNSIFYNMIVDGESYAVRLDWRTEVQGYVLSQIIKNN